MSYQELIEAQKKRAFYDKQKADTKEMGCLELSNRWAILHNAIDDKIFKDLIR